MLNDKSQVRQTAKAKTPENSILSQSDKVLSKSRICEILTICQSNEVSEGHFGGDKTYF